MPRRERTLNHPCARPLRGLRPSCARRWCGAVLAGWLGLGLGMASAQEMAGIAGDGVAEAGSGPSALADVSRPGLRAEALPKPRRPAPDMATESPAELRQACEAVRSECEAAEQGLSRQARETSALQALRRQATQQRNRLDDEQRRLADLKAQAERDQRRIDDLRRQVELGRRAIEEHRQRLLAEGLRLEEERQRIAEDLDRLHALAQVREQVIVSAGLIRAGLLALPVPDARGPTPRTLGFMQAVALADYTPEDVQDVLTERLHRLREPGTMPDRATYRRTVDLLGRHVELAGRLAEALADPDARDRTRASLQAERQALAMLRAAAGPR